MTMVAETAETAPSALLAPVDYQTRYSLYLQQDPESGLHFHTATRSPQYRRNFTRDVILTAFLNGDAVMLEQQLEMCVLLQGTHYDPVSGMEPGKIHHEQGAVTLPDREGTTTYNACDTTGLFLIGAEILRLLDSERGEAFVQRREKNLRAAGNYILSHINTEGLFEERPVPGSTGYAIRVGVLKDSVLPNDKGIAYEVPKYPAIFPEAHFISARGILAAGRLLKAEEATDLADKMFRAGISTFMKPEGYMAYHDARGAQWQNSSDELSNLAYIPAIREYTDLMPLGAMLERAQSLETPFGYQCTPDEVAVHMRDRYHADKVWIIIQALIHYGASKFQLARPIQVSASVQPHIRDGQELLGKGFDPEGNIVPLPEGNTDQIWSIGSDQYLLGHSPLAQRFML